MPSIPLIAESIALYGLRQLDINPEEAEGGFVQLRHRLKLGIQSTRLLCRVKRLALLIQAVYPFPLCRELGNGGIMAYIWAHFNR